jgi:extracellular factor (EF) 3-hydroxypalmitic acid methyl ester biosynthesis protein
MPVATVKNHFVLAWKMFHSTHEMSKVFNGNGNGNGANGLLEQPPKKAAKPPAVAPSSAVKESQVTFQTVEGVELRGTPVRVTRHATVFELYNPSVTPRLSEALEEFKIIFQERTIYSGRAVVRNVMDAGTRVVCEATLDESHWTDLNLLPALKQAGQLTKEFKVFFQEWQKLYKVLPEFKVVVADLQTFLHDLRLWLDQVELGIRHLPQPLQADLEKEAVESLAKPIARSIDVFIERFESIVAKLDNEAHPSHYAHLRRQLHPLLLVSPFAHRAFNKPLGYAGDYQVVDMMIRPPDEGNTLFAKIINIWLLGQSPAQAHRNRVAYLERKLIEETMRVKSTGRINQVLNLGCGPAAEVQHFFAEQNISQHTVLTLVDFNQETLQYLQKKLEAINRKLPRSASFRFLKKSIYQILKDGGRSIQRPSKEQYDYIYCAGLFDYLSDNICKQLMNIFYELLAPGGLLLATNATDVLNSSRPFRYSMEYLLDWHLIYRDKGQFADLAPDLAGNDNIAVIAEDTAANLFLEVRKPKNA